MDTRLDENMAKTVASFKNENEDELEITYPESVKAAKEKKRIKESMMREHPEVLISDYMGPDGNKVLCNVLFFTNDPTAWYTTLCSAWKCVKRGGISRGRQITLEGEKDIKLTVNLYHNGTVMVQGTEASLINFQSKFKDLKSYTLNYKQDQEAKATVVPSGAVADSNCHHNYNLTICTSSDTGPKTPSSPDTKGLRDALVQLEQDYIMFKEETTLNLQRLQDQIIHPDRNLVQQLCSAVRQLEEANQELRQEVSYLKEKLLRTEQHSQDPRPQPLVSRNKEPAAKNSILTVPDSTTNAVNVPVPPALPPQDQPPKHQQNIHHSSAAYSPSNISHGQQGTTPTSKENDNIFILCDSNGNHLNPRRLFPRSHVRKLWCPTIQAAKDILQNSSLNNPSHIIIHTGTNDLKARTTDVAMALINIIKIATKKHPQAKVIVSSLLPRRDIHVKVIEKINAKLTSVCAEIPNAKVAHHTDITIRHLYDSVHLHEGGMKLFAKNLKDTTLDRKRLLLNGQRPDQVHRPTYAAAVLNKGADLTQIRTLLQLLCDNLLQ